MTITFDVDDLAARLPEFLAEVEAGHQILIARGSEPLAHVVKAPRRRPSTPFSRCEAACPVRRLKQSWSGATRVVDERCDRCLHGHRLAHAGRTH